MLVLQLDVVLLRRLHPAALEKMHDARIGFKYRLDLVIFNVVNEFSELNRQHAP